MTVPDYIDLNNEEGYPDNPPTLCLVFSQSKNRLGNDRDLRKIKQLTADKNMDLVWYPNCDRDSIRRANREVKMVLNNRPGYYKLVIRFVLAHGGNDDEYDAFFFDCNDDAVRLQDFINDCQAEGDLGVPKLYFFQLCRKPSPSEAVYSVSTRADHDSLLFFAAKPGEFAWRDPEYGSIFIQTLCHKLIEDIQGQTSIEQIMKKVCRVMRNQDQRYHPYQEGCVSHDIFVARQGQ